MAGPVMVHILDDAGRKIAIGRLHAWRWAEGWIGWVQTGDSYSYIPAGRLRPVRPPRAKKGTRTSCVQSAPDVTRRHT